MTVLPPRRSLAASAARHLGGAVALVALAAVAFQAVGVLGDVEVVADDASDEAVTEPDDAEDDTAQPDANGDPDAADPDADPPAAAEPDDEAADAAGEQAAEEPDDDPDVADDADDAADREQDPPADDPPADRIDPGSITVQVLDGYQQDGGAAADALADELAAAGYDLIAQNPALRYDVTTVLWTAGNEDAARQVAADIGAAEVRAQPGTLSEQVSVHVVVGADRG